MNDWKSACPGRRSLPRELSAFEIEALFNFCDAERRAIEERRAHALTLGFHWLSEAEPQLDLWRQH